MTIASIEAVPFRLPPRRDFKWAGLQVDLGGFVLVRVTTDSGIVGYGEATPLPDWGGDFGRHAGETLATVTAMVNEVFAPALVGTDPTQVRHARTIMDRAAIGNVYAKCAVDMALHDAWGKITGLPVYKLLGGSVRASVPVAHMVGLMGEEDALAEAEGAVADGARALQIKGGVDAERDIRLTAALRRSLGPDVLLRLDANQGYGHPKAAIRIVRRLAEAGVDLVEQPAAGLAAMAEVTAAASVPIVADESCWDIHDALDLVAMRGADCISIYLAKAGGFVGAAKVAAIAEARHIACDVNGSIESAIGNAANVHFALAMPAVTLPAVIPISAPAGTHPYRIAGRYYEDDIVDAPFPVKDGALLPLDAPGLGIAVNEAKLARFRCG
ncbi:mandelate racemase/muconate lactonizing enzyme family protein [Flavisphingomonas formosensis]|uniref:mandelate racemase/muconate lactonizing enzyme family protein n=1 Tax=Flavisphingomonas formosensis TaxID=861534 RepID=UPI0012FAA0D6|nr:enolase C-terminal domain-like protein [Sphingomonas formosensis]